MLRSVQSNANECKEEWEGGGGEEEEGGGGCNVLIKIANHADSQPLTEARI